MKFEVGQKYSNLRTKQDGFVLEYDAGFILYAMLNGVSSEEKKQFETSMPLAVTITTIADISFFGFRFGNLPWADCPFSPALYSGVGRNISFPELGEADGIALMVLLVDSSSGELLHSRVVGLGHDFSKKVLGWAKIAIEKPMSIKEYQDRMNRVYQKYSTEQLVAMADYRWTLQDN